MRVTRARRLPLPSAIRHAGAGGVARTALTTRRGRQWSVQPTSHLLQEKEKKNSRKDQKNQEEKRRSTPPAAKYQGKGQQQPRKGGSLANRTTGDKRLQEKGREQRISRKMDAESPGSGGSGGQARERRAQTAPECNPESVVLCSTGKPPIMLHQGRAGQEPPCWSLSPRDKVHLPHAWAVAMLRAAIAPAGVPVQFKGPCLACPQQPESTGPTPTQTPHADPPPHATMHGIEPAR
jgi:hypothetical protein